MALEKIAYAVTFFWIARFALAELCHGNLISCLRLPQYCDQVRIEDKDLQNFLQERNSSRGLGKMDEELFEKRRLCHFQVGCGRS